MIENRINVLPIDPSNQESGYRIEKKVIALGIDQGIANLGYCVLSLTESNKAQPEVLTSGVLETNNTALMQDRIKYLYEELEKIAASYNICIIGTESLFVNNFKAGGRNKSAAIVATNMMTGVILLLGAKRGGILVKQYTPGTVKKYITGVGDASKLSVEEAMSKVLTKNNIKIGADHQSDAIAIAWTSAMDVLDNGLAEMIETAKAPRVSKRSKKPKIIQTKSFLFHAHELDMVKKKPEHIPHYLSQVNPTALSFMEEQAITGRFKKGKIMMINTGKESYAIKVGVEVGKKAKCHSITIPDTLWYCVELKCHDEKNINRSYLNLLRKLSKHSEYIAKDNGRVMEIISEQNGTECTIQIFVEVERK